MTALYRRRALRFLGAGFAFVAGCTELDGGGDGDDGSTAGPLDAGELPAYASALPARDGAYVFGAVDLATFDVVTVDPADEGGDVPSDPLLVNALGTVYLAYRALLHAGEAGFNTVLDGNERPPSGDEYVVFAAGANVFYGAYDVDGIADDLAALGYDERRRETEHAIYVHGDADLAVGATANAFVYATGGDVGDPVGAVERAVETDLGVREPKHAVDADFERALRAGDGHGITFGLAAAGDGDSKELDPGAIATGDGGADDASENTISFDFEPFAGTAAVVQHLDVVADADRPFASAVVEHADEDRVDESTLRSALGTAAEAVAFDRHGTTVWVEAEYVGEV